MVLKMLLIHVMSSLLFLLSSRPIHSNGLQIQPNENKKFVWSDEEFALTCTDTPGEKKIIKWLFDGREVSAKTDSRQEMRVYVEKADEHTLRLYFIKPKTRDSGAYECASFQEGRDQPLEVLPFDLKVFSSVDFTGTPDNINAMEGEDFSMICMAKFDPSLNQTTLSWEFLGKNIENDTRHAMTEVMGTTKKSRLLIRKVIKEDAGDYMCKSYSFHTSVTQFKEMKITLGVTYSPKFPANTPNEIWVESPASQFDQHEIAVNITCIVDADPIARFEWFDGTGNKVDSDKITNSENMSILKVKYKHAGNLPWTNRPGRHPETEPQKPPVYTCRARNSIDVAEKNFKIKSGKRPASPIVHSVNLDSNGLLTLEIEEFSIEPPVDLYRINIGDENPIIFNASSESLPKMASNNVTYTVEIDVPKGVNDLVIYAHNPVGWSDPSTGLTVNFASVIKINLAILIILGYVGIKFSL